MPLYQGSGFWGGKQYQELAELHLPGPSVVIDVRQGSDHDPPLIWDLAVELEDLTTEMRLNEVYRWRYLADCIDLLKLTPLRLDEPVKSGTDFILTTRTGHSKSLRGAEALIEELGKEHLDRVRNNRNGAVKDRDKAKGGSHPIPANPEQATVRVFFLVDAEDTDSLVSAATYAEWLKKWNHEYEEPGRPGRDRRLSTLAICMNAHPHRHHPYALAKHLNHTPATRPALDALILMHTYGDDEVYIGGDIQSYQVELILYVLLLLSLEGLMAADQEMVDNQTLSPYVFTDEYAEQPSLPWSIYLMGISSLEYSARWGARWLDYGLVAKIINIMHDSREVEQEQQLGRLRREVQEKLREWQQEVSTIVPDAFTAAVPELQALEEFQSYLASSPFQGKKLSSSVAILQDFSQRIGQLYTGEGPTLESAMESASLILWHIKRDAMQLPQGDIHEPSQAYELYEKLLALQFQAARLPASLFHGARGMLPRVLQQVTELSELTEEIRAVAENPPDLKEYRAQFELEAQREQEKLERLSKTAGWFSGGRKRQQREEAAGRLSDLARLHLNQVRSVVTARVALILLQEAGLYDPDGKICPYHRRLKSFDKAVSAAQVRASLQQQRAHDRLKLSLSETQVGISQTLTWLSLNSRKDLLEWEQIVESFDELYKNLESTPTSLNLLMEWLLRLMGAEKPSIITQQYLNKSQPHLTRQDDEEKERLHALSSMLVAVLLLLEVVGFDITALQPLLNQYIDLKDRSSEEPSVLESNILGLQRVVREAMLEKATRNGLGDKNQKQFAASFVLRRDQPIERVLAAWVSNQCAGDPLLAQTLDRSGILARLLDNKMTPAEALDDLRERNRLLGYRDEMAGDDRFYLLLAPGEASNDFLKELDLLYSAQIRPVRFPDTEKLIYLHIHRIRQIMPGYFSTAPKQLSPN